MFTAPVVLKALLLEAGERGPEDPGRPLGEAAEAEVEVEGGVAEADRVGVQVNGVHVGGQLVQVEKSGNQ